MNELFGLLDSLESMILTAKKMPLTDKIMIEEKLLLRYIDKIKMAVQGQDLIRKTVDVSKQDEVKIEHQRLAHTSEIVIDAQEQAAKVKKGANEYADYVLANLQLTLTKLQKDLIKLEKNIESGRDMLEKQKHGTAFPGDSLETQ